MFILKSVKNAIKYEETRSVTKIKPGALKGKEMLRPKTAVYDNWKVSMLKYVDKIISATEKCVEYKISTYNKVMKSIRRKSGSVPRSV